MAFVEYTLPELLPKKYPLLAPTLKTGAE